MPEIEEPFGTPDDLRQRWAAMPDMSDETLTVLLLDASQYIVDVCPSATAAPAATLRRIVCAVVRRSIQAELSDAQGFESMQQGAGPYQETFKLLNPHGDFYLTGQEKKALGCGKQRAGSVDLLAASREEHDAW